ncbi:hypothetical protein NC653_026636 [Populus alba x Populus x berolinensis]|uniref:Uncharacterized protein n=1 Tax=Populus alba x Populus x berolinensis TaxID=444605 RepID=A0AAD6MEJ3_9ROSI|nr:hypothetical protein NC653_026636 [Populus alba x Populus x berolinensis]
MALGRDTNQHTCTWSIPVNGITD